MIADFKHTLCEIQHCQKCDTSLKRGLEFLPLQPESRQSLEEKLLQRLPNFKCLGCHAVICLACGDEFDDEDEASLGDDDEDDFFDSAFEGEKVMLDWTARLTHCQNSTIYVIYNILVQMELVLEEEKKLAGQRIGSTGSRKRAKGSAVLKGAGYDSTNAVLTDDVDKWESKNEVRQFQALDQLESFLTMLLPYLPDISKENPLASDLLPHSDLLEVLRYSCLGTLIKQQLKNASLDDIVEIKKLFSKISQVVTILGQHESTQQWLAEPLLIEPQLLMLEREGIVQNTEVGEDSISDLVSVIGKQCAVFQRYQKAGEKRKVPESTLPEKSSTTTEASVDSDPNAAAAAAEEEMVMEALCGDIERLYKRMPKGKEVLLRDQTPQSAPSSSKSLDVKRHAWDVELVLPSKSEIQEYEKAMKALSFEEVDLRIQGTETYSHYYSSILVQPSLQANTIRLKAIAREISMLSTSTPVNYISSSFIRVAEDKFDALQLCITGPEGTPYANGIYLFDVLFPQAYPAEPPLFNYRTNGNGSWRANPNLYNNGKVCLSLLNTWSSNQWIPHKSTLLQVILSIQSMILVARPFFNEPGYGQESDRPESLAYNRAIRQNVVKFAMLEQLQREGGVFANVIKSHFKLKKDRILVQLKEWKEYQRVENCAIFDELVKAVKIELEKL